MPVFLGRWNMGFDKHWMLHSILPALVVGLLAGLAAWKISQNPELANIIIVILVAIPVILFFVIKLRRKWQFLVGIEFVPNRKETYLPLMAKHVRNSKTGIFYKGFTGHEFFTNQDVRKGFDENSHKKSWTKFFCIFSRSLLRNALHSLRSAL